MPWGCGQITSTAVLWPTGAADIRVLSVADLPYTRKWRRTIKAFCFLDVDPKKVKNNIKIMHEFSEVAITAKGGSSSNQC